MKKYKKRLYLVVAVFIFTLLLSWKMAIKPSIDLYSNVKHQQDQLELLENAPQQIALLKRKLELVDQQIGASATDIKQEQIINEISQYINDRKQIDLCQLSPVHKQQRENYIIQTFQLELEGRFTQLVQLLQFFEQKKSIGKIASTEFYIHNDRKNKTNKLRLRLYIQTFSKPAQL
nr:hypothetical protein [uncultured Draconibacterium sp.]